MKKDCSTGVAGDVGWWVPLRSALRSFVAARQSVIIQHHSARINLEHSYRIEELLDMHSFVILQSKLFLPTPTTCLRKAQFTGI